MEDRTLQDVGITASTLGSREIKDTGHSQQTVHIGDLGFLQK